MKDERELLQQTPYFLFIYTTWCPYCQRTMPYVKEYFKKKTYIATYLNLDNLTKEMKGAVYNLLSQKMKSSDPSIQKGRLLVPNMTLFADSKVLLSKTGLGSNKETAITNIENFLTYLSKENIS